MVQQTLIYYYYYCYFEKGSAMNETTILFSEAK